jgi:hypothetical protein
MARVVNLVVEIDTESGLIRFDGDGSREWIRSLFQPETNTYDQDLGEYVQDEAAERKALDLLMEIGILVDGLDYDNWMER